MTHVTEQSASDGRWSVICDVMTCNVWWQQWWRRDSWLSDVSNKSWHTPRQSGRRGWWSGRCLSTAGSHRTSRILLLYASSTVCLHSFPSSLQLRFILLLYLVEIHRHTSKLYVVYNYNPKSGVVIHSTVSLCLCCSSLNFWQPWPRNFIFCVQVHLQNI